MQAINRQPRRVPDGAPVQYQRHRPEQTTLYRLVQQRAATLFEQAAAAAGADLPQFVKDEFDAFLESGILAYGSLQLRCGDCGHDEPVAFSCKRRGCLKTLTSGHAAVSDPGVDALHAANKILTALCDQNTCYRKEVRSAVKGITHPYVNVGLIEGGTNTNVTPGKVVMKVDRRMIPEENPIEVEATLHKIMRDAVAESTGITVDIKRMLMANALKPLDGNNPLVDAFCSHATKGFGEPIEASGAPLYIDSRLFCEQGIPAVLYGCGPRTVLESNAKRADEHVQLEDLRRATEVAARSLAQLLERWRAVRHSAEAAR